MPVIDLTRYIVAASGTWTDPTKDQNLFDFTVANTQTPGHLLLRWPGDFVALTGPLRIRVTVQAENLTLPLAYVSNLIPDATAHLYGKIQSGTPGTTTPKANIHTGTALNETVLGHLSKSGVLSLQASTIYSYTLDIAAGQAWPFSLSEQLDALRHRNLYASRLEQLGNNLGYRVLIEPAFAADKLVPVTTNSDLPCDFAVANHPDSAHFFPAACEPCDGSVIGLPPSDAVGLPIPPADGGCVRTRFFNGMFITREDLETEQRYHRLKSQLHNRAAGAGVVWGLGVGKQGNSVCVLPGYGVDCCGNDLTLSSMYEVSIAALLADPAATRHVHTRGAHRLHLLLEYVECPSNPRPVHGDPCAPEATRCEMSRIRESVRLRLVPPCDYNAATESAPIQRFLDEVRQLQTQFPVETVNGPVPDRLPFQLRITINGDSNNAAIQRPPSSKISQVTLKAPTQSIKTVTVEAVLDPLWTFVHGSLSGTISGKTAGATSGSVAPPNPTDLSLVEGFRSKSPQVVFTPSTKGEETELQFRLVGWQAQTLFASEDDAAPGGDLTLKMTIRGRKEITSEVDSKMEVKPLALAPTPCDGEPCSPSRTPGRTVESDCGPLDTVSALFSGDPNPVLPWLHTDPTHPSSAGDPKVLALAALGGWLAQMLVREQVGTAHEVTTARREIAQGIYRLAWLLLFGVSQKADPAMLGNTLHRLLEAWCDNLLWKGPRCCCDPHGVVIGCVIVEGGTIQKIDPFGGRRHVLHYPLLQHWGAQFGIAPIDITASRFFSQLCCLADLPAPTPGTPQVPATLVSLGGGFLAVGDPKEIVKRMKSQQHTIVEQRSVSTPEMIASAFTLIATQPTSPPKLQYTALTLDDFVADQTVMLLLPTHD